MFLKKRYRIILIHALCWFIYTTYVLVMSYLINPEGYNLQDLIYSSALCVVLFYVFALYLLPLFSKRRIMQALFVGVLSFVAYCFLRYIPRAFPTGLQQALSHPFNTFLKQSYTNFCLFVYIEYLLYAIGYWFAIESIKHARKAKEAERRSLEIENQFLKAQVNPHFLYNTLSFFYVKLLKLDPDLADGLATLTDIMRYSLRMDTDLIPLSQEVEHLENLVKINQLRFNNKLHVKLDIDGNPDLKMTLPHSIITLAENAFKYSDLQNEDHPLQMHLIVDEQGFSFWIHNKKATGSLFTSNGTGLYNLRRRLAHTYKNAYALNINDDKDFFTVKLSINA